MSWNASQRFAIYAAFAAFASQGELDESCTEGVAFLQSRLHLQGSGEAASRYPAVDGLNFKIDQRAQQLPIPLGANTGLYDHRGSVVDLPGQYPWDVAPDVGKCPVLMEFYSSLCPHCIVVSPLFAKVAQRVDNSSDTFAYTLAAVDCATYVNFCAVHNISMYPTFQDYASGNTPGALANTSGLTTLENETAIWEYVVLANDKAVKQLGQQKARACAEARAKAQQAMRSNASSAAPVPSSGPQSIPHPDVVWLADQQRALFQALGAEAVRVGTFSLNRALLPHLRSFVDLAVRAFPDESIRFRLAHEVVPLLGNISERSAVLGDETLWMQSIAWLEPAKSKGGDEYFGCRGSLPHLRGYTCALWQTFHALLVNANFNKEISSGGTHGGTHGGLATIHSWIKHFFGCRDCVQHFLQMSEQMNWKSVATDDASVLWLWRAHNIVNDRLRNDTTADPAWPKVQFPSPAACPDCRLSGEENTFNEQAVLGFLRAFYAPAHARGSQS